MPLDANLYVLQILPSVAGTVVFKEEGKEDKAYSARKEGERITLIDGWLDDVVLGEAATVGPKLRLVELLEPPLTVEVRNTGGFRSGWEWSFEYEEVKFAWDRQTSFGSDTPGYTLSVSRKPDPDFPVVIYTPANKRKPSTLQLLDYNLQRIEPTIKDKKGLEILTILSVLTFTEHLFNLPPSASGSSNQPHLVKRQSSGRDDLPPVAALSLNSSSVPPPPQRPSPNPPPSQSSGGVPPMIGLSTNELEVRDKDKREEDCKRCLELLKDDSLLYLTLHGQTPAIVPHVVALAAYVKTARYKASGEELLQYIEDGPPTQSGAYPIPSSIKVYLSRLELDELLPNYKSKTAPVKPPIRPPINFDSPGPSSGKIKKGKDSSEGGGGGGLFGWRK